jgi:hypothetical protein
MKTQADICRELGCEADIGTNTVRHVHECPLRPGHIAGVTPVASIAAARFERAVHPEQITPRDALVAALDWLDSSPKENPPTHIIVLVGADIPGLTTASGTKFFQGGTYRHHAQMGLCLEAMHRIRDGGLE